MMPRIADLLLRSCELAGLSETPELDLQLLLCHALDRSSAWLVTWPERIPEAAQQAHFDALLERRIAGEPIAYLLGTQGFWSLDLQVSNATLIPRPETEMLVEMALKLNLPSHVQALDLGTGSGAIALALASERPEWHFTAVDSQASALAIAEHNRSRYGLQNVEFCCGDWYAPVAAKRFELIVSNPPYIDPLDDHLQRGDVRYEPRSALVSSGAGLDDLRHIVGRAPAFLARSGWLLTEHGFDQAAEVRELFAQAGFQRIASHCDLNGVERITLGCISLAPG
jgi:release factor glutamine methyltransferase